MKERLPEYLEPGEIKRVLSIPDKRSKLGFRDYLILRLLAETEIRRGELSAMRICNLQNHNGGYSLFFPSLKKRKVRGKETHKEKRSNWEVPLRDEQMAVLEVMPKRISAFIFILSLSWEKSICSPLSHVGRKRLQNKELQDL